MFPNELSEEEARYGFVYREPHSDPSPPCSWYLVFENSDSLLMELRTYVPVLSLALGPHRSLIAADLGIQTQALDAAATDTIRRHMLRHIAKTTVDMWSAFYRLLKKLGLPCGASVYVPPNVIDKCDALRESHDAGELVPINKCVWEGASTFLCLISSAFTAAPCAKASRSFRDGVALPPLC